MNKLMVLHLNRRFLIMKNTIEMYSFLMCQPVVLLRVYWRHIALMFRGYFIKTKHVDEIKEMFEYSGKILVNFPTTASDT
jgi:hypothetical protein